MILSNYFLWSGLLILIISGTHFILQRKLMDRGTKLFIELLAKGTLICALGIILTSMRKYPSIMNEDVYMILLACRYFVQTTVPFDFFMIAKASLNLDKKHDLYSTICATIPLIVSLIANIVNIFTPVIAYIDEDYNFCAGPYFDAFFVSNIFLYAIVILYLIFYSDVIEKNKFKAMCEVNVIVMLGTILQYYLQVQFFFGLALALALLVLYITLNSPTSYIDLQTQMFNLEYFKKYISEMMFKKKSGYIIVVDFYQFERVKTIYDNKMPDKLLSYICNYIWNLCERREVFKISDNRFAIHIDNLIDFDNTTLELESVFAKDIEIEDKKIHCPALILRFIRSGEFETVEDMLLYINFLCDFYELEGETKICEDTKIAKEEYDYEQAVEKYIEEAIRKDLFEIYYQPIYSFKQKEFVSLEALSRLKHPDLGWIRPDIFIKVAVKNGMLLKIMPKQMQRICEFVVSNKEKLSGIESIKINLAPREIVDYFYFNKILNIIAEYDIPYGLFQFEITESTAIKFSKELEVCIKKLENVGIDICMDDFGSGYANLSMLYKMPFKIVKIDRSLIKNITKDEKARTMYNNIVDILKKNNFTLVSEGVETIDEAKLIADLGVDMAQGFYFSKPLSSIEVIEFLNSSFRARLE